jgi:integrase/recombinase XerD
VWWWHSTRLAARRPPEARPAPPRHVAEQPSGCYANPWQWVFRSVTLSGRVAGFRCVRARKSRLAAFASPVPDTAARAPHAGTVGWPKVYRLSDIPRSISWDDVNRVLASVDRRTVAGRRDYAILLLLVTYGLRGREVAALTLDDVDWKRDRLAVPERKAGHSTAFPLSTVVGEAIIGYLRNGRPTTPDRHMFLRAVAPWRPIGSAAVSSLVRSYILMAGVKVPRPGSHTLRHSAVQRLTDANFDLKTIGDFVGHRSARSTEVYAKVAVEALREVALGDVEEAMS